MSEGDAIEIMYNRRHLYMSVDDRCGPPYTIIFDDDYSILCSWARASVRGRVWSKELTDAAVEIFESEKTTGCRGRKNVKQKTGKKTNTQNCQAGAAGFHLHGCLTGIL